jgi:N-acetylmuramoyl-L-alanine amidase
MNTIPRKIDLLVVHCSATVATADIGAAVIRDWHKQRGFKDIGYHYVIRRDGKIERGRPEQQVGAHVQGFNAHSIGICRSAASPLAAKRRKTTLPLPSSKFWRSCWPSCWNATQGHASAGTATSPLT